MRVLLCQLAALIFAFHLAVAPSQAATPNWLACGLSLLGFGLEEAPPLVEEEDPGPYAGWTPEEVEAATPTVMRRLSVSFGMLGMAQEFGKRMTPAQVSEMLEFLASPFGRDLQKRELTRLKHSKDGGPVFLFPISIDFAFIALRHYVENNPGQSHHLISDAVLSWFRNAIPVANDFHANFAGIFPEGIRILLLSEDDRVSEIFYTLARSPVLPQLGKQPCVFHSLALVMKAAVDSKPALRPDIEDIETVVRALPREALRGREGFPFRLALMSYLTPVPTPASQPADSQSSGGRRGSR